MDTGVLGLLARGAVAVLYYAHYCYGGLVSGEKGIYSRSAPFFFPFFLGGVAGTSTEDSVPLPAAAHPFPSLRRNAAPSSEHSWAHRNVRAAALVLETGVGDQAMTNRVKRS